MGVMIELRKKTKHDGSEDPAGGDLPQQTTQGDLSERGYNIPRTFDQLLSMLRGDYRRGTRRLLPQSELPTSTKKSILYWDKILRYLGTSESDIKRKRKTK